MQTPSQNLTLTGLVERVTFHNDSTGYCVLRLKVKGQRDLVTLLGHTPSVTPGEFAHATGQWIVDKQYGRQFRAQHLRIDPPTTLAGIERYLGSGMVKGIGPHFAQKLVRAFGQKVFDVIEHEPDKLYELKGIGPKRVQKITSGWSDQKVIRSIMVFLHGHGVSTSKSVRIFKTYGQDAVAIVSQNPYRLAKDIRGIGFKSADTIARNVGIEPSSPLRARAGVAYALNEASANGGHCCLARSQLVALTKELLDIDEAIIDAAIDHEVGEGTLTHSDVPQPDSIFLSALYVCERTIAAKMHRLLRAPLPWPSMDADKALAWVQEQLGMSLASSQAQAVRTALSSKAMVITGGPGVGKTTIVRAILAIFKAKHLRIELCAPTGRAAKRLAESCGQAAKTIHRMLEINPQNGQFQRNEDHPIDCDVLVVDECSMVDVVLASSLMKAIAVRSAVIFVGDVDQLPSVGPGAFLSSMIASGAVPVSRLTEVFRQAASSWIIRAAHQINKGRMPQFPTRQDKGDCYFVNQPDRERLAETVVGLVRDRLPKAYGVDPIADIQVLCPMNRGGAGARALNEALQQALNPSTEQSVTRFGCTFGVRDKVMQIENNYEREVFNGDIGFVEAIDSDEEELVVDFDGRLVTYPFGELDELVLCYATTIHKSQGSEYPVVVLPLTLQHYLMLKRNLLYTGITRGKRLVVIVGEKRALAMAVRDARTEVRMSALAHWLALPG